MRLTQIFLIFCFVSGAVLCAFVFSMLKIVWFAIFMQNEGPGEYNIEGVHSAGFFPHQEGLRTAERWQHWARSGGTGKFIGNFCAFTAVQLDSSPSMCGPCVFVNIIMLFLTAENR
jgi:hypothetical protein